MLRKLCRHALRRTRARARLAAAGTMVSYPSGSETVSGYLAAPEGGGKKPAIVVIHEWWGLNDWAKGKADGFAKQGYVALAVDLYRGKVADGSRHGAPAHARHAGRPAAARHEGRGRLPAHAARRRRGEDRVRRLVHGRRAVARPRGRRADARRRRHLLRPPHDRPDDDRGAEGAAARQLRRPGPGHSGRRTSRSSRPPRRRTARASTSRSIPTPATASRRRRTRRCIDPADAKDADARTDAFFAKVLKGK